MCDPSQRPGGSATAPRPSWSGLYLRAGTMLVALPLVQALVAAGEARTALQCGLVLGGFAAMAQWTRRNRAALDHLDWCECASSRTTVRVIQSRDPLPVRVRHPAARPTRDFEPVEAEAPIEAEEIVR
jgi:hypothetical protein